MERALFSLANRRAAESGAAQEDGGITSDASGNSLALLNCPS